MEIQTEDYKVWYDSTTATVNFRGILRENGIAEYQPIENLLNQAIATTPPVMTMNLRGLEFLNSSGMTILSRFVIGVRKKRNVQLVVNGSNDISWQKKTLGNWQRLMPSLKLNLD